MKIFAPIFLLFFLSFQTAQAQEKSAQKKPTIVVSINPIYRIILAITKDKSNNVLIMSPNVSEHEYNLKKSDIKAIRDADLIFYVSADLEKNFPPLIKNQNKNLRAFELTKISGIKLLQLRNDAQKTDPHIWLNPQNAVKIAEFVTKKIAEIDAKNSAEYYENLEKFKKEVFSTEKTVKAQLSKIKTLDYISFHDGYQYFENYFNLKPLKVIANSHDSELSISDAKEIDLLVNQSALKCIVGEKWDEKNTAQKLARNYQLQFLKLDSLGGASYLELLRKISEGISKCS